MRAANKSTYSLRKSELAKKKKRNQPLEWSSHKFLFSPGTQGVSWCKRLKSLAEDWLQEHRIKLKDSTKKHSRLLKQEMVNLDWESYGALCLFEGVSSGWF